MFSCTQIDAHVSPSIGTCHRPQFVVVPLATVAFSGGKVMESAFPLLEVGREVTPGGGTLPVCVPA